MRPTDVLGPLTVAAAAFGLGACGGEDAEARPTQHEAAGEESSTAGEVPPARGPAAEPLTPGSDGTIEPEEGQVLMPPELAPEEGPPASNADRKPQTNDPTTPDSRDQLERDRVEEGRPQ